MTTTNTMNTESANNVVNAMTIIADLKNLPKWIKELAASRPDIAKDLFNLWSAYQCTPKEWIKIARHFHLQSKVQTALQQIEMTIKIISQIYSEFQWRSTRNALDALRQAQTDLSECSTFPDDYGNDTTNYSNFKELQKSIQALKLFGIDWVDLDLS